MPTAGGFDHFSGFNHPTDADFLALEDIVYGYTRRLREDDSDDDDSENGNTWLRCCLNSSLTCPICKAEHVYAAPANDGVPEEHRYSHDARVIFASFGCPICLEDAGPPMVVLPCGHAICQEDFRLLGGRTTNAEVDDQVRQAVQEETQQHRESINHNQPTSQLRIPPFLRTGREDMDRITTAMMHAFASSLNEAIEGTIDTGDINSNADEEDEESTDSEMPDLIRPPVLSFDSRDDEMRELRVPSRVNSDDEDMPERVPPRRHVGNSYSYQGRHRSFGHTLLPAMEMLGSPRSDGVDIGDDDNYYFEGDDEDADDDRYGDANEDIQLQDSEEILWRLSEYHPGNAVLSDTPTHPGFPKLGQWLLVPEVADNDKVNLIYYCEYQQENNLFVAKQFPRGTRMIPNGKHGVYVYTPPRHFHRNGNRRQRPRNSNLWEIYYMKNFNPDSNRHRGRQESAQLWRNTVNDPILRYKIPKSAHLVADGKGGIWALCHTSSLPEALRSQTETTDNHAADSSETNISSNGGRRQRNQQNRQYRLVHYTRQDRNGTLVGGVFPPSCKLFMDQSGGVILFQQNNWGSSVSSSSTPSQSVSSLWHISDQHNQPQTLLYGGLPSDTKMVGDSSGSSVFLLSSGGRLQSVLTRLMVEHSDLVGTRTVDTPAVRIATCFSYDLDIGVEAVQDIVDIAEGDTKQVFLHARMPSSNATNPSQGFRWRLCRVSPQTEAGAGRDVNVSCLNVDCPRTCRIVSDRERGVWVWKKPSYYISPGDRCFVHVYSSSEGVEEWNSPCVFPSRTHLVGLGQTV